VEIDIRTMSLAVCRFLCLAVHSNCVQDACIRHSQYCWSNCGLRFGGTWCQWSWLEAVSIYK